MFSRLFRSHLSNNTLKTTTTKLIDAGCNCKSVITQLQPPKLSQTQTSLFHSTGTFQADSNHLETTSSTSQTEGTKYNISPACESTYYPSPSNTNTKQQFSTYDKYDVIIIGSGHNGLVAACYLAKFGRLKVLVLERRDVIGGACITEEIFPGYKFSRASYLAGLLRPCVIDELNLKNYPKGHELTFLQRNPSSFTPTRVNDPFYNGKYLMFYNGGSREHQMTLDSIAQFSEKDASLYDSYEDYLGNIRGVLQPLLDYGPPMFDIGSIFTSSLHRSQYTELFNKIIRNSKHSQHHTEEILLNLYEIMTSPASKILNRYFESDILKTTLATDAVIGTTFSANDIGSAYVLLHHVMGQIDGNEGVWAYCQGGMGTITQALQECAIEHGVEIVTNATVKQISTVVESNYSYMSKINSSSNSSNNGGSSDSKYSNDRMRCNGVFLENNEFIEATVAVLSNVNPYHTFVDLFSNNNDSNSSNVQGSKKWQLNPFNDSFLSQIKGADYQCGAFKINCVVNQLPNFDCCPNTFDINDKHNSGAFMIGPQHKGTVHFESRMIELETAALQAKQGIPAERPIIEMTIPSSLDSTLITNKDGISNNHHIVQLFIQYAPYTLNKDYLGIENWDDANGAFKLKFAERVFNIIDEFAPNFKSSILYCDILSPRDLEKIFGLYKGNIFHGALTLDQLGYGRPVKGYSNYQSPLKNLYMCGAGTHPGGGVMGAPGRNCAKTLLSKLNVKM